MSGTRHQPALWGHPLAVNSFRHWVDVLRMSGGVDGRFVGRALLTTLVSPLFLSARLRDRVYDGRIEAQEIEEPPIFIVGHWRTGTTHLHNLMGQDPRLAFISFFQAMAPRSYLARPSILRSIISLTTPEKRPMDNMELSVDLPQEEEFAVCHLSPYSAYLGFYFPRRWRELFSKYVLFRGIGKQEMDAWKKVYMGVIRKATFHSGGKRLVLKNPVNTARIRILLELFPGAKFIHLYRDPYVVFKSTQKLYRALIDRWAFQECSSAEIEENVLLFYRELMERFFDEKGLIPAGGLAEVKFEDLEKRPMVELERIFEELSLPGWEDARAPMEAYLARQRGYRKNELPLTGPDIRKVEANWGLTLERWGYERPASPEGRSGRSPEGPP